MSFAAIRKLEAEKSRSHLISSWSLNIHILELIFVTDGRVSPIWANTAIFENGTWPSAFVLCGYLLYAPPFQVLILSCVETHVLVPGGFLIEELLRWFRVMDNTFPHWFFMTTFHPDSMVWCNIYFGSHQRFWQSSWAESYSRNPVLFTPRRPITVSW